MRLGYVEQDASTRRYNATVKVVELARAVLESRDLTVVAAPHLKSLWAATSENTHLAVLAGEVRRDLLAVLVDEVADAVRVAAEEAEAMASIPVEYAAVGLGGLPIQGLPATASVPVTGRNLTVTDDDLRRALTACAQVSIPQDFRVLDIIACGYALDGQSGMQHPVGMPGTRLDASAFVVYTNKTHADTVEQTVNRAAVAVKTLVYEPLAAADEDDGAHRRRRTRSLPRCVGCHRVGSRRRAAPVSGGYRRPLRWRVVRVVPCRGWPS